MMNVQEKKYEDGVTQTPNNIENFNNLQCKIKKQKNNKKDIIASFLISLIGFTIICLICLLVNIINGYKESFFYPLYKLDVYYYDYIVNKGYTASGIYYGMNPEIFGMTNGTSVWAFFPLVPLCIKFLKVLTFNKISSFNLAIIFSTVCMGIFFYFIIKLFRNRNTHINYFILSVLFVFNTFFIFYFNFYTESFFMMLTAIFLNLCDKKKYFASGLVLSVITVTRVTGALFVFYLLYKICLDIQVNETGNKIKIFFKKIFVIIKTPYYLASLAVTMLGLATFIIVLDKVYGLSPLAFMDAQRGWEKENKFFIKHILYGFSNLSTVLSSIFTIISIVFCILLIVKEKKYFIPIIMLAFIIITSSSSIASMDRYIWGMLLLTIEAYTIIANHLKESSEQKSSIDFKTFIILFSIGIILFNCILVTFTIPFNCYFVY